MNKTFEDQIKTQVQYPEYINNINQKKTMINKQKAMINKQKAMINKQNLRETGEKMHNLKNLISILKKELIDTRFKEKDAKNHMIAKLGNLNNGVNKLT